MAEPARMHDDELPTDAGLARRLIAEQFPRWGSLAIAPAEAVSTDNAIYRLGRRLAVRLPRRPSAVAALEKECAWLSLLSPQLPLPTPVPLAKGAPRRRFSLAVERLPVARWPEPDGRSVRVG
jgi:aminoglycoside phosphotransferase (APT) family kinase protein